MMAPESASVPLTAAGIAIGALLVWTPRRPGVRRWVHRLTWAALAVLIVGVLALSGCRDVAAPVVEPAAPTVDPTPVLNVTMVCPTRLSYWHIARNDTTWPGTMILGAFGLHAADSLAWVVDFDHNPLPSGVQHYRWIELNGLDVNGGLAIGNDVAFTTDRYGRASATVRCAP